MRLPVGAPFVSSSGLVELSQCRSDVCDLSVLTLRKRHCFNKSASAATNMSCAACRCPGGNDRDHTAGYPMVEGRGTVS
jgi:hypothetical protein